MSQRDLLWTTEGGVSLRVYDSDADCIALVAWDETADVPMLRMELPAYRAARLARLLEKMVREMEPGLVSGEENTDE